MKSNDKHDGTEAQLPPRYDGCGVEVKSNDKHDGTKAQLPPRYGHIGKFDILIDIIDGLEKNQTGWCSTCRRPLVAAGKVHHVHQVQARLPGRVEARPSSSSSFLLLLQFLLATRSKVPVNARFTRSRPPVFLLLASSVDPRQLTVGSTGVLDYIPSLANDMRD